MPPVRSVSCNPVALSIIDKNSSRTLTFSTLSGSLNTATKVENYINNTWIPANITDYEAAIHVFTLNPLRYTIWTGNKGMTPPTNWWVEE